MSEEWEYTDFVWTDARLSYGFVSPDMIDHACAEWWAQVQSTFMAELQPWLDDGWEPTSAIGPSCWELEEVSVPAHRFWSTELWILFGLGLLAMACLPLLLLLRRQTIARPVAIRVPLRRQNYGGLASQVLERIDIAPGAPYLLSGYGFSSIVDAAEIYLFREGSERDKAQIALEHLGSQVIPALLSAGVKGARLFGVHGGNTIAAGMAEGFEKAFAVASMITDTMGDKMANDIANLVVLFGQEGADRLCRCIYRDDRKQAALAAFVLHAMPSYSRQTMILLDELVGRLEQRFGDDDPGRTQILVICALAKGGSPKGIRYLRSYAEELAERAGTKHDQQQFSLLIDLQRIAAWLYLIDVKMPIDGI